MTHLPRFGPRRALAVLAIALVAVLAPALALAAARKLNAPLAVGGQVAPVVRPDPAAGRDLRPGYQLAPDGATVVYIADHATAGVFELWGAPLAGGAPVRLSGPLVPGGAVVEFAIDPDGRRVVYRADQRVDESFELFSAPIGGGAPVALNSFLVPGGDVTDFAIGPGGTVVFRADRNDDEVFDLFSVALAGGPDVRLNRRADNQPDVQPDFAVTPDGRRALFRYNPADPATFDLFSAPIAGDAPPAKLGLKTVGEAGGPSVLDFAVSPDSSRVALRARDPATGSANLLLAPAAGDGPLFGALTALGPGRSVEQPPAAEHPGEDWLPPAELPYAFTRDSARVVFIADVEDGVYQLHAVAAALAAAGDGAPPAPALLSPTVTGSRDVTTFRISPAGERIVFRADIVDNRFELISVLADGTSTVFLFPFLEPFADVRTFAIAPDGERVISGGDYAVDGRVELRGGPIDSTAGVVPLNTPLAPGDGVRAFELAAGRRVVYSARGEGDAAVALYSALDTGGGQVRLSPPPAAGGAVEDFVVGPGPGAQVVFRADLAVDEVFTLAGVPAAGGAATTLTSSAAVSGDVEAFALTPDNARAVYLAEQRVDEVHELFAAPLAGGPPVRVSGDLAPGGDVRAFTLGPDSARAVYLADQDADEVVELYSAPLAGGPAVRLNPPLAPGGDVSAFKLGAGGAVVYLADQEADGVFELFAAPIAGGSTPVRLSASGPGKAIHSFAISADGRHVVYLADAGAAGAAELLSVPIAGGAAAALNAPLPAGGAVRAFELSPDGARAVYAADQREAGVVELFSVPIAGGQPVRLSPNLAEGRDVYVGPACRGQRGQWDPVEPDGAAPFLVGPGSRRVVYCADQDADEVLELYSAPLDGGAPAVKLNVPPGAGGGVRRFELSPDGARAVFTALTVVAGSPQEQLYAAPVAGGDSPPALLNAPVRPQSFVQSFAVSPDGATVAFAGDQLAAGRVELFAVAITGGAPSRRNGELAPGGNVAAFRIGGDGTRVVYLADQEADGAPELFAQVMIGNGLPMRLNEALPPGGAVQPDFRLSGSAGAVFRADQDTPGVVELYGVSFKGRGEVHLPLVVE
jgi:hypothetical protein